MMKILLVGISALFLYYASGQSLDIDEELYINSTICHRPGFACKNCYESIQCVQNGSDFIEVPAETCGGDDSCLNGQCTSYPNPSCNNNTEIQPDFMCQTPGMYPDPFDCTKFHYCIKNRDISSNSSFTFLQVEDKCGCNYSYNMKTTFCDIPLINGNCQGIYPIAICFAPGDTGSFWMNPSLYYICRRHPYNSHIIYPFIYACENGKIYNPSNYLCN
ncbi:hypothetical protein FQR65_LT11179 [Abscondita terminalis]|nr:hypothetical protein FQR65_LT11179 [Abscondita terminalis]